MVPTKYHIFHETRLDLKYNLLIILIILLITIIVPELDGLKMYIYFTVNILKINIIKKIF